MYMCWKTALVDFDEFSLNRRCTYGKDIRKFSKFYCVL